MKKEELKQEREARFWTQIDLANKGGFLQNQVSEWETGKRNISLRSQKRLKALFDNNPL